MFEFLKKFGLGKKESKPERNYYMVSVNVPVVGLSRSINCTFFMDCMPTWSILRAAVKSRSEKSNYTVYDNEIVITSMMRLTREEYYSLKSGMQKIPVSKELTNQYE